ncbi:MAG: hypothetical protein GY801_36065, partial [bacterium]|nr:hypothetical protein [bacterium]
MDNKLIILAFVVGAFLSLCSTFVVRSHSEGWTEIFPLSLYSVGVNAGGWPFGFVGFGTRPPLKLIKEIYEFGPIFFLLNTIFWGLSCFLTVTLMEFCVQHCLLKSTWLQWLALLIFLAPALYGLIGSALYKLSFFNLPSASLPNFKFAAAKWLSFDEPENALVFINITYWGFVGLFLTLLLLDIFHDQKVILFRYPIFTAGVILFGFMLNHPLLQTYLQQRRDRPFIVDSITITPRENGAGYILEYRLIFPELPKEEIVYEMSCSGFDRLR